MPDLNDIAADDWVARWLPRAWRPYARLCRLDRPIGTWLTLLPCVAALVQAADGLPALARLLIFALGALLMRGVGCTINDMCDRRFDQHVERTRSRPLTSGELTLRRAVLFLLAQLAVCALLLFLINPLSRWLAVALVPLVFLYPLCKRFTYWPQAVLGAAFNWGMLMAWSDTRAIVSGAAVTMWLGTILWQIGYDTIYAYVDLRDDARLGLRSTALKFRDNGKAWVTGFYIAAVLFWTWSGWAMEMSTAYYVGIAAVAAHLGWQLWRFDLHQPAGNFRLFRANLWIGALLLAAALGGTLY
jgi:4-hydroxybenzoate polyprenyltransferase